MSIVNTTEIERIEIKIDKFMVNMMLSNWLKIWELTRNNRTTNQWVSNFSTLIEQYSVDTPYLSKTAFHGNISIDYSQNIVYYNKNAPKVESSTAYCAGMILHFYTNSQYFPTLHETYNVYRHNIIRYSPLETTNTRQQRISNN